MKEMTRKEYIKGITEKIRRAKPEVRREALRGLQYQKKSELARQYRNVKVTRGGDISFL